MGFEILPPRQTSHYALYLPYGIARGRYSLNIRPTGYKRDTAITKIEDEFRMPIVRASQSTIDTNGPDESRRRLRGRIRQGTLTTE